MFRRFSISTILLYATFPQVIDFEQLNLYSSHFYDDPSSWTWQLSEAGYEIGLTAFNGAPELGAYFAHLKKRYHADTVIETGTFRGATTFLLAHCFNEVHTIELMEAEYNQAKERFKDKPHVHCYQGSSEKILGEILPSLKDKMVIFYLDAHWYHYWPIFDELEEISKTHRDNCIIVVDDIKVPGRSDIGFDYYEVEGTPYECSYDSIKKQLDKIFTEYSVHYLIPKNPGSRAKLVALPKR